MSLGTEILNARLFVTGATGFVGSALVQSLIANPQRQVVVAVRSTEARFPPGVERRCIAGALSEAAWHDVLSGVDAVVHLAARAHVLNEVAAEPLTLYRSINRDATLTLARAAAKAGVRRFVFISSIGVNGTSNCVPFRFNDSPAPEEPYAISKHEAEFGLWEIARETGLEVVVVRPPLVYGPGAKGNFRRLLRLSASGFPLPLGAVKGVRSLVSIWNLCDLLIRCVEHPAAPGHTFLAGDGEDIALPDLIRALSAGMHRSCGVFAVPSSLVRTCAALVGKAVTFDKLTASLQVDISETRRVLDWTPPVPLEEGLARTAHWYAQNILNSKWHEGDT